MKRLLVFSVALIALTGLTRAEDAGFIRVDEDEKAARLQTGITRFAKGGAVVDLIGAVHIGDKTYYEDLNRRFTGYEVLLFEMIGGDNLKPEPAPDAPRHPLGVLYETAARTLKLVGQVDHIDYHAENFLNADLTFAEFQEMQEERGETLFNFMIGTEKAATQPNPLRLLIAVMSGRADLLETLAHPHIGRWR